MWAFTDTSLKYAANNAAAADASHPVLRLVRRVFGAVPAWLQRDAWRAELESLDDRTLSDLAIGRGDFPAILAGTFSRPPADLPEERAAAAARAGTSRPAVARAA